MTSSTNTQPSRPRPRRIAVEGAAEPASRPPERAAPADPDAVQHAAERSVDVAEGTIMVRRTVFGAEHEEPAESVRVPIFRTAPARVRVSGGMTISMGNMEFSRVDVVVEVPCYPEESEVNRAVDFCERIVGDRLSAQVEMIQGMTQGTEHEQQ